MGILGPGLWADDEALDVRDLYRDLAGDEVPDDEAERRVIEEMAESNGYLRPVVWLALADTQSRAGRLSERVKSQALAVIDEGSDLAEWDDASPRDRAKRRATLTKLRARIVGPQPRRRTIRREWKYRTDLEAGDVLSIALDGGVVRLVRVVGVDRDRFSDFPLVELLDVRAAAVPPLEDIGLRAAVTVPAAGGVECRWTVVKNERREPDWDAVGFSLVGRVAPRDGDLGSFGEDELELAAGEDDDAALDALVGELLTSMQDEDYRNTVNGAPFTTWEHMLEEIIAIDRTGRYAPWPLPSQAALERPEPPPVDAVPSPREDPA